MSEVSGNRLGDDLRALLARVPAVERVLSTPMAQRLIDEYGHTQVVDAIRATTDTLRRELLAGVQFDASFNFEAKLVDDAQHVLAARAQPHLRSVFNLTGTVLHTNLGR
ncbi:L-seryl-tRNA(Sec) selenium transferase, partial [Paraburkholderia sp. CNPSo 3157]|nr:L-seryl-tRNA(Sec) selenium transferase [Paraburkholderia franconis]